MREYEESEIHPSVDGSVKTALVTGAGSGIGAATACELARAGMQVVVSDINLESAESVAAELPHARAVQMDVTSPESIRQSLESIARLDVLVNNAGIGLVGDIAHTSLNDFERVMQVNVTSVFLVTQIALGMLVASRGSIVNIASVGGLVGIRQRFA